MRSPRAPRSIFLDSAELAADTEKERRGETAKRTVAQPHDEKTPPSGRPAASSRQAPLALFACHLLATYDPAFRLRQRSPVHQRPAASLPPMPADAFRLAVAPLMAVFAGSGRAWPGDGGPQAACHRLRVSPRSAEHKRPPPPNGVPSNYPSASPLRDAAVSRSLPPACGPPSPGPAHLDLANMVPAGLANLRYIEDYLVEWNTTKASRVTCRK